MRPPAWLLEPSDTLGDLARRVLTVAAAGFDARQMGGRAGPVTVTDVVTHLAEELDADEADVLRALAELDRAGLIAPRKETA